jgi:hypothetical protein
MDVVWGEARCRSAARIEDMTWKRSELDERDSSSLAGGSLERTRPHLDNTAQGHRWHAILNV